MKFFRSKSLTVCILISILLCKVLYGKDRNKDKAYILGISVNNTSFVGDIGDSRWMKLPVSSFPGFFYTYTLNHRLNYKLSYTSILLMGKDSDSNITSRKERGLNFSNTIHELMGSVEFSFNRFYKKRKLMLESEPYLVSGLALLAFNDKKNNLSTSLGLPFGIGYRWILEDFAINFEIFTTYTFSDDLDYVRNTSKDNDWFFSMKISVGYVVRKCACVKYNTIRI